MAKLQIFISHLTVEAKFADQLGQCLKRDFIERLEPFISTDATSIPVGSEWFDRILAALQRAELQLVICSHESVQRPWINYEAGAARVREIPVVPLCHSSITPDQLPVPLSMSEGVLLTDPRGLRKLYVTISGMLASVAPEVDFESDAAQFKSLEEDYRKQRTVDTIAVSNRGTDIIIENPRVLCVTSKQYMEMGFRNQVQMVLAAFPGNLEHGRVYSSAELKKVLMKEQVHIVHIAAYVCPRVGYLYFSPIDLPMGTPAGSKVDRVSREELKMLLKDAGTRLVVITSGDSLALATDLLSVTNVIAPNDIMSAKSLAVWVKSFYEALRFKTLSEACDYASVASQAHMRLLTQQTATPPIQFRPLEQTPPAR